MIFLLPLLVIVAIAGHSRVDVADREAYDREMARRAQAAKAAAAKEARKLAHAQERGKQYLAMKPTIGVGRNEYRDLNGEDARHL